MEVVFTLLVLLILAVLFILPKMFGSSGQNSQKAALFEQLKGLKSQVGSSEPSVRRDLIVRLDALLGKTLRIKYGKGSVGMNLKKAKDLFDWKVYQSIWESHKLRNQVVHENVEVSASQAKEAYDIFKLAISKLLR